MALFCCIIRPSFYVTEGPSIKVKEHGFKEEDALGSGLRGLVIIGQAELLPLLRLPAVCVDTAVCSVRPWSAALTQRVQKYVDPPS